MITIVSYTIYHSPNAYLGVLLAERALANLPVVIERRPICIPKDRGVKVADLVGGKETAAQTSYHREDCLRWAQRHGIELRLLAPGEFDERAARWHQSPYAREELPARAYYASLGTGKEAEFDRALFRAAWVEGLDVNDDVVVRHAAVVAGLDADALLDRARQDEVGRAVYDALAAFDRDDCPGVPTWIVHCDGPSEPLGERFWGKDRVDWLAERVRSLVA
ncbi:MAG: DsbA family protein [Deltaproteobacteria bacterium]|nr:DsbA family protein [Deltaproteobacteria bacterium]MBI3390837.1 DsbA family protein [Deltaproteobacteria bacterium]